MKSHQDGENVETTPELVEAARSLVRECIRAVGKLPTGADPAYAFMSTATQLIIPAVLEVVDDMPGDETDKLSHIIQGVGAALAARFGDGNDSQGLYLAMMIDVLRGMANVQMTRSIDQTDVDKARDFLSAFGIMPAGKAVN